MVKKWIDTTVKGEKLKEVLEEIENIQESMLKIIEDFVEASRKTRSNHFKVELNHWLKETAVLLDHLTKTKMQLINLESPAFPIDMTIEQAKLYLEFIEGYKAENF